MSRIKLACLAVLAILTLGIVVPAIASAEEPEITEPVPTEKVPVNFTSSGGTTLFESEAGQSIKCEKLTNSGTFTGPQLGTITFNFKECKEGGARSCKTGTAPAGEVKIENADINFVSLQKETKLTLGAVVKFPELTVTCEAVKVVLATKNGVLGTFDEVTSGVQTNKAKLLFHQSKGRQELKVCERPVVFCEKKEFFPESDFGLAREKAGLFSEDTIDFAVNVRITF
jgi:hypothetical protein